MRNRRWIAVDFDGTLATFGCNWPEDYRATGQPIPTMVERVKQWIADGEDVRIFTARMDCYHPLYGQLDPEQVLTPLREWMIKHIGVMLPVTNVKDYWCKALYDDRAVQVEKDTGRLIT